MGWAAGRRAPLWLWVFAVTSVLEAIVAVAIRGPRPLAALLSLFLAFLFAWLLLRGGRVIWCLMALGGVFAVVSVAWGEPVWKGAISLFQLALLLAPSSRRYVWKEAVLRRSLAAADGEADGLAARAASGLLGEEMWSWIDRRLVNWTFVSGVFLFAVAVEVAAGVFHGDRHDTLVMVLWRITHVAGTVGFFLLLVLLIAIGVRALARHIGRGAELAVERWGRRAR